MTLLQPGCIGRVQISPTQPKFYHRYALNEIIVIKGVTMHCEHYQTVNRFGLAQVMPFDAIVPLDAPPLSEGEKGWGSTLNEFLVNCSTELKSLPIPKAIHPRTQKARGIYALWRKGLLNYPITIYQAPLTKHSDDFKPVMARPCPSRPRHGFVDSRVVKTPQELNAVLAETLQHDPRGEVLCMPYLKETYSAVVTNDSIVFGKGTNGATAGKKAVTIPCLTSLENTLNLPSLILPFRNGKHEMVDVPMSRYISYRPSMQRLFVETVGPHTVQLRTGPLVSSDHTSTTKWSPIPIVIPAMVYTVDADVDFLEYEKNLDELKRTHPAKFVVHFPGGSLLSHLAVQAIAKNVPITVERAKPKVGCAVHFPKTADALPVRIPFRKACMTGIKLANTIYIDDQSLKWAAAIIQGIGPMTKTHASAQLLLAAAVVLMRAGTGICLGEYRHFFDKGPGRYGFIPSAPFGPTFEFGYVALDDTPCRSSIYDAAFSEDWSQIQTVREFQTYLHAALHDFNAYPWQGAFGGQKWGQCTQATLDIMAATLPFYQFTIKYPRFSTVTSSPPMSTRLMNQVIAACNRLITISHNSGRCLTKILAESELANISNGHTGLTIAHSPLTAKVLFS